MIRATRALSKIARVRYASTATEASTASSASVPPPSSAPPSQASSPAPSGSQPQATRSTSAVAASPSPSPASDLSPVFGRHVPLPQTHGVHVATLHLRSYTDSVPDLQFFTSFALRAAKALGLPTSGAVALPTRTSLFTVPRSPFAHKKSQQNFWRKEHKRAIKVWDGNEEIVQAWLAYLRKEALGGVGMKAQVFTYRPVGWGQALGQGQVEGDAGLTAQEEELLELSLGEGDVERLAKELQEEIESDIKQAEGQEQESEPVKTGPKEAEVVDQDKAVPAKAAKAAPEKQ
ncbi:mitochondrial 37S ribosomal protein uS10m RSM10 [Sporobolomyces koalae]|uniref:mitochondrial 37S ribosomal protein uS10m RSM10 n=1 Tax=Sporobolomyces koalae TaxID=500713 RepID=UPI00317B2EFA